MTKLFTPTEVAEGSLLLGRWQLQNDELYTPLLGGVIKTIVTGSDQLTLTVANRHHPLMPSHYWAVRVNHTAWRRYSAALPIEVALPAERNLVEIMTAGNTDLDDVWSGNQGFALTKLELKGTGRLIKPSPRPVVAIYGDSITAGCWVNGYGASSDYRPEQNFVGLAQDKIDVDLARVAYSAAGVLRPATGEFRSPSTGSTISTPRRLGRPTRLVCRSSTSGLTTGALARPTLRPPTNNT